MGAGAMSVRDQMRLRGRVSALQCASSRESGLPCGMA